VAKKREREWEEREQNRYNSERVRIQTSSLVGPSGALSHATETDFKLILFFFFWKALYYQNFSLNYCNTS